MINVNSLLVRLFEEHGQAAIVQGPGILFPGTKIRLAGLIARENPIPGGFSVQFDVKCEIEPRRVLVESFAGIGPGRDEAILDAVQNFTNASFPVILSTVFGIPSDLVTYEEWQTKGGRRLATIGGIVSRGQLPMSDSQSPEWLQHLIQTIQAQKIPGGTHWVRLFYAQKGGQVLSSEVLLDNKPWHPVHTTMASFAWPASDPFYSLRIFLVLQNL